MDTTPKTKTIPISRDRENACMKPFVEQGLTTMKRKGFKGKFLEERR